MTTSIVITGLAEFDAPGLPEDPGLSPGGPPGGPPGEVVESSALYASKTVESNCSSLHEALPQKHSMPFPLGLQVPGSSPSVQSRFTTCFPEHVRTQITNA